jgi:hypothetical protein
MPTRVFVPIVQRAVVLDVGSLADLDPLVVAARDRAVPDAGVALEPHLADHGRVFGDPVIPLAGKIRRDSVKLVDGHSGGSN